MVSRDARPSLDDLRVLIQGHISEESQHLQTQHDATLASRRQQDLKQLIAPEASGMSMALK